MMHSFFKNNRLLVSAFAVVILSGSARADVAGFFPREDIDISLRFENLDDHPGHEFYLKYGLGGGNPYASMHLTKIQANTWIRLHSAGGRTTEVYVMAVPRGQTAAPPPEFSKERDWFDKAQPGGLQGCLPDVHNGHEIDYRVSIEGNKIKVVVVNNKGPWLPMSWEGRAGYLCAGLALAAGFVAGGMIFCRRRKPAPLNDGKSVRA